MRALFVCFLVCYPFKAVINVVNCFAPLAQGSTTTSRRRFSQRLFSQQLDGTLEQNQTQPATVESTTSLLENDQVESNGGPQIFTGALLRVSYDGYRFSGWSDNQPKASPPEAAEPRPARESVSARRRRRRRQEAAGGVRSVEGVLLKLLARLWGNVDPSQVVVEGCSRTDKGVHAIGQVCQVYCLNPNKTVDAKYLTIPGKRRPHPWSGSDTEDGMYLPLRVTELSQLGFRLNRMLPPDLRITGVAQIPPKSSAVNRPFHATLNAQQKTYRYTLALDGGDGRMDPIRRGNVWHVVVAPDKSWNESAVREAANLLVGRHDFRAWRNAARGASDQARRARNGTTTICTVDQVAIEETRDAIPWPGNPDLRYYSVTVRADRFLYKMVRNMVGTLVAVGLGRLSPSDLDRMLTTGERDVIWECAPARGLVLEDIRYDRELEWLSVNE